VQQSQWFDNNAKHWMEEAMELKDQADHIAILALMMVGVLTKRLMEVGQLDKATADHLHKLVRGVRTHAKGVGLTDLNTLFNNIDDKLSEH
jgi:TorA maturation chaperone TorD